MANSWKNLSDGDIVRKALASFHNKLKFIKTINRQYDNRFAKEGSKNDGVLLIKMPNEYNVTDGAVMTAQDTTELTQTLTVATQKHVGLNFTSFDKTMSIESFQQQCLEPAMSKLAAIVENTVLSNVYKDIFNYSGTPATTLASILAVLNGGVKLSQNLAPISDRHILMNALNMAPTVNAIGLYFHKASELERAFSEGYIGQAAGFKWWESEMSPSHTNGTRTDSTPVTDTSAGTFINGATTLVTTGQTSGQTLKKGDVFTIADVYAVNLETKGRLAHLQQWVMTADLTADATDTFAIAPTIYKSGPRQNIEVVSAGASKAIVHVAAGGSGTASQVNAQPLAYHRDAFTFVSADLYKDPGQRMSSAVIEGISMRLWRGADIINDKFPTRIDVLFGYKTLRPQWACRVRG